MMTLVFLYENCWLVWPQLAAPSDFSHYFSAAQRWWQGRSPYSETLYNYPPLLSLLVSPLAALSYVDARTVWFCGSLAALFASAWLLIRQWNTQWANWWTTPLAFLLVGGVQESLALGQVTPFLLLLSVIGLTQNRHQAVAFGFGTAIKFLPGLVAIVWFRHQQWSKLFSWSAIAALLFGMPWLLVTILDSGHLRAAESQFLAGTPATLNISAPAVALRLATLSFQQSGLPLLWQEGHQVNVVLPPWSSLLSFGTLSVILIWFSWRIRKFPAEKALWSTLPLMVVVSPIAWTHYEMLVIPVVAKLLTERHKTWTVILMALLAYRIPVEILRWQYVSVGSWSAVHPMWVLGLLSLPLVANLWLVEACWHEQTSD
jgi:hypothetical protein